MSRPIKFRAWDTEEKEYYYDVEHTYDFFCSGRGCFAESFGEVLNQPDRFIVEQDTGLKDKNGKEIYEGDIVNKRYVNFAILDSVGVVEMGELYDSDGWTNSSILGWRVCARYEDSSLLDVCSECEVIGNIHENPELLEEAK